MFIAAIPDGVFPGVIIIAGVLGVPGVAGVAAPRWLSSHREARLLPGVSATRSEPPGPGVRSARGVAAQLLPGVSPADGSQCKIHTIRQCKPR